MGTISFCILLVLSFLLALSFGERGLDFPSHDGKNRLINLSKKNFNRFLKKYDILVGYFLVVPDSQDDFNYKQWKLTLQMLELSAQITEREGIGFGVVELQKDQKLAEKLEIRENGAIYAFKSGHKVEFTGQRSADIVVEFVLKLDHHPVEVIDSKTELQGFKRNDVCKVVGYFESTNAAGYDDFVDAAQDFQPTVPFYVVFQKLLAKQLGLAEVNQVDIYEPFVKRIMTVPGKRPLTNEIIEQFVRENKQTTLRKLRKLDMYDTWENVATGVHVVVFADESDPEGFEFLQMMKELAQTLIDNEDLSIVWIDPDEFALLHDYWEQTFGIDLSEPQVGIVNVSDADSVWMDRRKSRLPTYSELEKWMLDVLSGKINTEDDDDDYNLDDDSDDDESDDEHNNDDDIDDGDDKEDHEDDNNEDDDIDINKKDGIHTKKKTEL